MTNSTTQFLQDLDRVSQVRGQISDHLQNIVQTLVDGEHHGQTGSGSFNLDREIQDMRIASKNLKAGVFRLLVLGDMKRGKSTFLNALIGENLLPSDVNPCTALLTILRYGPQKQVTVHFKEGRPPQTLDFETFKQNYTIDPAEAKQLEQSQQDAFPSVSHAVVEYPLELLEKGVEIVDSPGLNDTEARNELSLGYIQNCHAILFVLRATQPCTLAERRYLDNYIKGRGLSTFFLINAWDQIRESLIDPDDTEAVKQAEARLHQVFRSSLQDYCLQDGHNLYDERVFNISALQALRTRLKDPHASLEGTGFQEFMGALNTFLTQERIIAEFRQSRTLARQTLNRIQTAIARRIPLLNQGVEELEARLDNVQPEFEKLTDIGEKFRRDIQTTRNQQSRAIADSFKTYILGLSDTFETDFLRYQPEHLGFLSFLNQGQRESFNASFEKAFQNYLHDKLLAWANQAEKDLKVAFEQLKGTAETYGKSYQQITDRITEKLTGQPLLDQTLDPDAEETPGWAKWAMGLFSVAMGNFAGATLAMSGFSLNSILLNLVAAIGVAIIASSIFGVILGPITFALVGLGLGALQADHARKRFTQATKKEFIKHLPRLAQEQWQPIYNTVQDSFDQYETEVMQRLEDDINSRKAELNNLLEQKKTREINREAEQTRLKTLEASVKMDAQAIDGLFSQFIHS